MCLFDNTYISLHGPVSFSLTEIFATLYLRAVISCVTDIDGRPCRGNKAHTIIE